MMLSPAGRSEAEQWVAAGKRACAQDLAQRLLAVSEIERVIAVVEDEEDDRILHSLGVETLRPTGQVFEFGSVLSDVIETESIRQLAYFGGASAPLLRGDAIAGFVDRVQASESPLAIANNLHSTDWLLINRADLLVAHSHRFPTDNPLGWVLSQEVGVPVVSAEPSAATRLDIDTPTDLFMAWAHPAKGSSLSEFLDGQSQEHKQKLSALQKTLGTPATTLAIIGRASAHLWQKLVTSTQIWIRLFVEERGMVASHRLARGEVQSLIGQMLDLVGPDDFIERLSTIADAALWDTRVWMGTRSEWPSDADRFASDLGWVEAIEDEGLRELTRALAESPIPILAGGYGVVGGGLYALLESMDDSLD
jgi:hypothetical protein